jgi:hypothetical protein
MGSRQAETGIIVMKVHASVATLGTGWGYRDSCICETLR